MKSILFGVTIPMTANAFLKPQIKALISEGWDVHLVCNLEPGIEELARIAGLRVHPIPMKRNPNPIGDLISLYRWINLLRKLRPNIVIGSTPKAALLSMLGSKFTKIPVRIYHARGFRAEGLTGVAKKISLLTEKITIKLATEILCDSSSLRDSLINHGCLPKNSGIVIGLGSCCGVDTEFFRPPSTEEKEQAREKLGYKHEDFIVGFVGRLTTDKGINELLKAGLELYQLDNKIKTAVVGPVEKNFALSKDHYNPAAIRFFQETKNTRLYYWAFDIFVLPSYREGFPIAPLEAQSCGLTLITTKVTGCVDSQPSLNSILSIPSKDYVAIVTAVKTLVQDPELLHEISAQSRIWVQENFEAKLIQKMHIGFLNQQLLNP